MVGKIYGLLFLFIFSVLILEFCVVFLIKKYFSKRFNFSLYGFSYLCWGFLSKTISYKTTNKNYPIHTSFRNQIPFFPLDEMLESENSSMAERLYDLERQVLEQQEEILSLKSTLSEVLRRLNNLDCNSSRISSSTSSSSSYETTIKNNRSKQALWH